MSHYFFDQLCHPTDESRPDDIVWFLGHMQDAMDLDVVYDTAKRPFDLNRRNVESAVQKIRVKEPFPEIGVEIHFFSRPDRDERTCRYEIHVGTHIGQRINDTFSMTNFDRLIDSLDVCRECISRIRPYEAFVGNIENELALDTFNRYRLNPNRPAIIRWFHYLDEARAKTIGGIDTCLNAPIWTSEQFCQGVLMQLCEEPFDAGKKRHLEIQKAAMRYFQIPTD